MMKKLYFSLSNRLLVSFLFFIACGISNKLSAQCTPIYEGSLCQGNEISFSTHSPGATDFKWLVNGTEFSQSPSSKYIFTNSGTYNITLNLKTIDGQNCSRSINLEILPVAIPDIVLMSDNVQCNYGNQFSIIDNSIVDLGNPVVRLEYRYGGVVHNIDTPSFPINFDFNFPDKGGNFYNFEVRLETSNGCVSSKKYNNFVEVKPSLGVSFTSNKPQGCDSVLMTLSNTSTTPISKVTKFLWDFGDGTYDSITWSTPISHKYFTKGQFNVCLTVTDTGGCIETFCINGAATNHVIDIWIESEDSLCYEDQPFTFEIKPNAPSGINGFVWNFGNPSSGPMNFRTESPIKINHKFSEPGPFLINYTISHPVCGVKSIYKQVTVIGPFTNIQRTGILINQRYQCRSQDTVFFTNSSTFFHNDRSYSDDAGGHFDTVQSKWIYYFDSSTQVLRFPNIDNRGSDCVLRVWDFDDDYAPRCTTDHNPIYPQNPAFNNMHMTPDPITGLFPKNTYNASGKWINCRYSHDSLPKHWFTDWDSIYRDSFYLLNRPLNKTIVVLDSNNNDSGCYSFQIDTTDAEEHRNLFYSQIARAYNVKLSNEDTCNSYSCKSEIVTPIVIMRPNAQGLRKQGRYCFGGPPNFGVTFELEHTKPGITSSEVYINPDTALNPTNWISYLPGGQYGNYQAPGPILPYFIAGPYPNQLFRAYPNPSTIKDTLTGYANVGLIIGNGIGANRCYDTAYYEKFIKFPILDPNINIISPNPSNINLYNVCKGDSLVMSIPKQNRTIPHDADQITYSFTRIAPHNIEEGGRFPFYSYIITENYEWFVPQNGGEYLENFLNRTIIKTFGNNTDTLLSEKFSIGTVEEWQTEADISQVFDVLDVAFEALGFVIGELSPRDIAHIIALGCVDTTGFGDKIQYYVTPMTRTSTHFRDTSIYPLDNYGNSADYTQNAYSFIGEENGIFNLDFTLRSNIGGCIVRKGHRVIVGYYNRLTFSDSVVNKETEITGIPFFRYWHIDPENNNPSPCQRTWMDCSNFWLNRNNDAGLPGKEGLTKWDWSKEDDDTALSQTIFGSEPYGSIGYESKNVNYKEPGIYTLRVAASDSLGCKDTISQRIYVTGLFAKFGIALDQNVCKNTAIFNDSSFIIDPCIISNGSKCDSIKEWTLNWGDGSNSQIFNLSNPLKESLLHTYKTGGLFNVKLTVKSALGNIDSLTKQIEIDLPEPTFTVPNQTVCKDEEIIFTNTTPDPKPSYFWIWDFGDGTFQKVNYQDRNLPMPHSYNSLGMFFAKLTLFDSSTSSYCATTSPTKTIKVSTDLTYLSASKDTVAIGEFILFNASANFLFTSIRWIFDVNSNPDTVIVNSSTILRSFARHGEIVIESSPIPDLQVDCVEKKFISVFVDSNRINSVKNIGSISYTINPNPVVDFFKIEGDISQIQSIEIFDAQGRFVRKIKVEETQRISVSDLSVGVYFVELTTFEGVKFVHKMLKE